MKILGKSKIYRLLLFFVAGLFAISCSKDKEEGTQPSLKGDASINMSVLFANDDIKLGKLSGQGIVSGASKASLGNSTVQSASTEGFVAYDDMEVRTQFYAPQENNANVASNANVAVTNTPLTKKYRVLMYKQASTTPVVNVVVTPGVDPLIKVDAGFNYKLVVFSINENTVPNIQSGTNTIVASDLTNKDVLYYTAPITTVFGNNNINVILRRKTSRIAMQLDVRGLFGGVNPTTKIELGYGAGTAFTTIMKTAELNLFTETFGTPTNVAALGVDKFKFDTTTTSAYGLMLGVMNFYTIGTTTVPAGQLKVKLGDLDIWADVVQAGTPPVNQNVIKTYTRTLTFPTAQNHNPGFTTAEGKQFSASLELVLPKIIINSKVWAPANLVYEPAVSPNFPYRFKPDNQMDPYDVSAASGFWNWRSMFPTNTAPTNIGDPCAMVFPAGTWRMPTEAELQGLINLIPGGGISTANYDAAAVGLLSGADIRYVFNRSTPANRLDLRMYGIRNVDGTYDGKPEAILFGLFGGFGTANFWSSTASGSTQGRFFEGNYSGIFNVLLPTVKRPTIQSGARNIGRNIRCISDNV